MSCNILSNCCLTTVFPYRSGQFKCQLMTQNHFMDISDVVLTLILTFAFVTLSPTFSAQNIARFLLRKTCAKRAPMSLTGTKHMNLGCATYPGDFRGWTVLLCVGLSMSTVNCDGHCQTANAKEGSWQVLPCDYKSAMVKVGEKKLSLLPW